MKERGIEQHLVQRVKGLGGEVRKVQWIGRRGAPDRLVMLPEYVNCGPGVVCRDPRGARAFWAELKAPGEKPRPEQRREHERMRGFGLRVEVIDSIEAVEALLA